MVSERASQRAFFGVSALRFAASAAVTIVSCASMSAAIVLDQAGAELGRRHPASAGPRRSAK
jgi:hypothetical protein